MEERHGVKGTVIGDIFFTESNIEGARVVDRIEVEISRQNANLLEVKKRMAAEATRLGANAIMNFTYGQKAHRGLRLLIPKWDTESWHGSGDAAVVLD